MTEGEVHEYIKKLKREPPVVAMHKTITHYTTRTIMHGSRRGPSYSKYECEHREHVCEFYRMDGWKDASPELTGLSADTPTRVTEL